MFKVQLWLENINIMHWLTNIDKCIYICHAFFFFLQCSIATKVTLGSKKEVWSLSSFRAFCYADEVKETNIGNWLYLWANSLGIIQYKPDCVEKRVLKETTDRLQKMKEIKEVKFKCSIVKEVRTVEDSSYHQSTVHYILVFWGQKMTSDAYF